MTLPSPSFWRGKRVLLTGHTGFKGSWLAAWLFELGADVHGLALAPETDPNLHDILHLPYSSQSLCDLRDADAISKAVKEVNPQIVLHLAAQALVRRSYEDPVESIATNVLGTAHLLDALRGRDALEAVLVVTSDKAYDNPAYADGNIHPPFREGDALGGRDPYSASKGAQEIVTRSFAQSFFKDAGVPIVTARAGNVIGGGDWSKDRLMTDIVAAATDKEPVLLRNPQATRPWQHVLDPIAGYMAYVERMSAGTAHESALNFGPDDAHTVAEVVDEFTKGWPGSKGWTCPQPDAAVSDKAEASVLSLDPGLAKKTLGWHPKLSFSASIEWVASWHLAHLAGHDMAARTRGQISQYQDLQHRQ